MQEGDEDRVIDAASEAIPRLLQEWIQKGAQGGLEGSWTAILSSEEAADPRAEETFDFC